MSIIWAQHFRQPPPDWLAWLVVFIFGVILLPILLFIIPVPKSDIPGSAQLTVVDYLLDQWASRGMLPEEKDDFLKESIQERVRKRRGR